MKVHVGVGMATGLVHTVVGTAGNVADVTQALWGRPPGVGAVPASTACRRWRAECRCPLDGLVLPQHDVRCGLGRHVLSAAESQTWQVQSCEQ
jgi:hypothetical protein